MALSKKVALVIGESAFSVVFAAIITGLINYGGSALRTWILLAIITFIVLHWFWQRN